ncbi:MAG: hypothetical protein KKD01_07060 [Proteobacteria bacterium]|nr:hypothetical protein [Pseudomonadota bacterium]MBU1418727.1 hypothetical protein [Pseudomonadota bacterium]MBU1454473.1 hypothetical protein [Pseudomonadota bacterium]
MLYIERNSEGKIVAVSKRGDKEGTELKSAIDEEILQFLAENGDSDLWVKILSVSDLGIIRILEDLVDLLVAKNLIMYTDLPEDAQEKIRERKKVRQQMGTESLVVDDII